MLVTRSLAVLTALFALCGCQTTNLNSAVVNVDSQSQDSAMTTHGPKHAASAESNSTASDHELTSGGESTAIPEKWTLPLAIDAAGSDTVKQVSADDVPPAPEGGADQAVENEGGVEDTQPLLGGDESLEAAWAVALAADQKLEASRWRSSAAQSGLFAARAERLPSARILSSYVANNKPLKLNTSATGLSLPPGLGLALPAGIQFTERDFVTAAVVARQPLVTFGRIKNAIDAAGEQVAASQADESVTQLDIKLNVAEAYINVLRVQRLIEVAESSVTSLTEHERIVANRLKQGLIVRNDLLAVQVRLANARQDLLKVNSTLRVAESAYNRSLGRPLSTPVNIQDLHGQSEANGLDSLTGEALALRPEISSLNAQVRSLRSAAASVRAAKLPQISLVADYAYNENRFFVNEDIASVSVVGDWNFFDAGRKRHSAEALTNGAEGLIRLRNDVESIISLQVRQAWLDLNSTLERVQVNRDALKSAEENVTVSRNQYNQGTVTNTVVLDAVTLRTASYSRYYNSVYDAVFAHMRLRRAVGDL